MELWSWFLKGGYVMYPILLCSVLALAITVERLISYYYSSSEKAFFVSLKKSLQTNDVAGATNLAAAAQGDCAKVTRAFLQHRDLNLLENDANLCLDKYDKNLIFLEMIVTVSPLLGLLGTIVGMISAFKVFDMHAGQPFAITAGIGEALVATAFGLIVAIVALSFHGLLRYWGDKLSKKMKKCCNLLEWAQREGKLA